MIKAIPGHIFIESTGKEKQERTTFSKSAPFRQIDFDELIDIGEACLLVDTCLNRGANLNPIVSDKHKNAGRL